MMMYVWVQGSATMDKAPKVKNWLQSVGLSLTVSHSRAPWFGGIQSPSVRPNDWEVNKPRAKTQNLWKTHWRFQAQWRPRSGRGKLQVTSEIFGHQVKTFTLDVTLSEVPLKTIISVWRKDAASSCYRKSMDLDCIHLLMSEPQNSEANDSWNSIQNCFLNKNFMWFFSMPWLDRDPKWKEHVSQFLLAI